MVTVTCDVTDEPNVKTINNVADEAEKISEESDGLKDIDTKKKKKKSTKDWSKITEDSLEKDWKNGDSEEELEDEWEHSQKIVDKKKKLMEKEQAKFDKKRKSPRALPKGKKEIRRALSEQANMGGGGIGMGGSMMGANSLNMATGTAMYFVDINPIQVSGKDKGKRHTQQSVEKLAGYWASMLKSASLAANVYNIGASNDEGQMLVSIDKGWQTKDILKFCLSRPEMVKMSKDQKSYFPGMPGFDWDDDDEDDL